MDSRKTKFLFVRVIEAIGIVQHDPRLEPFVRIKINGKLTRSRSTRYRAGVQWWEKNFVFKIKNPDKDYIEIEVREKGYHVFGSDWIGDLKFNASEFRDGHVHQNWYKLSKSSSKKHSRPARGFLHLAFHLVDTKNERPFTQGPNRNKSMSIQQESVESTNDDATKQASEEPLISFSEEKPEIVQTTEVKQESKTTEPKPKKKFQLNYQPTILESNRKILQNAYNILKVECPTNSEFQEMQRLVKVNCLHKGNFESCQGKRYMVALDGSNSSNAAFNHTLSLMDPERDHLFIVTVREKLVPLEFYQARSRVLLTYKVWKAAADIIEKYQEKLKEAGIKNYTSIMPEADDARYILCALARKYKADTLVLGRHKKKEKRSRSPHFRSFVSYCQQNAKCSVLVY